MCTPLNFWFTEFCLKNNVSCLLKELIRILCFVVQGSGSRYSFPSTLFHPGGLYDPTPFDVFKISLKRLSLRRWNFVSFSSYHLKRKFRSMTLPLHMMTSNDGANFTVKVENKWNTYKISSKQDMHSKLLQKLIDKIGNILQKKEN